MENIFEKYLDMYEDMKTSKDPKKMMVFGEVEKWAFKEMAALSPQKAQQWIDKLEAGLFWNTCSISWTPAGLGVTAEALSTDM